MADQKVPYEIEEEEETEEEEEEPKLKYVRLGNVVEEILQKDTASCLAPHEKFLVRLISFAQKYIFIIFLCFFALSYSYFFDFFLILSFGFETL